VTFVFLPALDLVIALPILLGRDALSAALFGTPAHGGLVAIALATAFAAAQFQLFLAHLRADDRSRDFVLLMGLKGAVSLAATLALVFGAGMGVRGFLLGSLAGPAVVAAVFVPRLLVRAGVELAGGRVLLRRMLAFGVPLVPASLGLWVLGNLDTWLLRVLADLRSVGVFGFASELCLPIALLLTSIQLAWPSFAFGRARRPGGAEEVARVYRHLFVVLVGGGLVIAVLRREILAVLATATYAPSERVIPPLALATCLYGLSQAFGTGLQVAGDTRRLPLLVLAAAALNAGLNVLAIPRWQEMGAAWATVATNVVLCALVLRESHRQFRVPFEVGRLVRVFAAAGAIVLVAETTAGLPALPAAGVRLLLVGAFAPLLVPAGALSAAELRALPRVALEILRRRPA
jgi:O-antigen/teichoic acid export membrane protein